MGKGTNFSWCAHQGFFDYFIAGISDGSIRHGDNSDYSSGTVVVWKAFGENLKEYLGRKLLAGLAILVE